MRLTEPSWSCAPPQRRAFHSAEFRQKAEVSELLQLSLKLTYLSPKDKENSTQNVQKSAR